MVEKRLRKEIDGIVLELVEIGEELGKRFSILKKIAKPAAIVFAGIIALKIALGIFRMILSFLWLHKLLVTMILILGPLGYRKVRSGNQGAS